MNGTAPQFSGFTLKADGRASVLWSDCGACAAYDPKALPRDKWPPFEMFKGIWDTGATHCCITQAVIDKCQLKPTGIVQARDVRGETMAETFLINILLPNRVAIPNVTVTRADDLGPESQFLIGMDVITRGDFAITNVGGRTVFSFRIPSIRTIDYVSEANAWRARTGGGGTPPAQFGGGRRHRGK